MTKTTILPATYIHLPAEVSSASKGRKTQYIEMKPIHATVVRSKKSPSLVAEEFLSKALEDHRIDKSERKQLLRMGFAAKRLAKLAGKDGCEPLRNRMRWYGETLQQKAYVKSDAQGWIQHRPHPILQHFAWDTQRSPAASRQALPGLTNALKSPQREIRFQAAEALRLMPEAAARRALSTILNSLKKEKDGEVFNALRTAAVKIGFAPSNLKLFTLLLSQHKANFPEDRLELPTALTHLSDRNLELAHAGLQKISFSTPRVRYTARVLTEALVQEYKERGKEFSKVKEAKGTGSRISRADRKLETQFLAFGDVFRGGK